MTSHRILGLILFILGAVCFFLGLNATHSVTEEVSEGLTGAYTDQTTWYLLVGLALALVGGAMALLGRGGKPRSV